MTFWDRQDLPEYFLAALVLLIVGSLVAMGKLSAPDFMTVLTLIIGFVGGIAYKTYKVSKV